MPINQHLQAWRRARAYSVSMLATKAAITAEALEAAEAGELDPPNSMLEALGDALGVPVAWLHSDPASIKLLFADSEDADGATPDLSLLDSTDPVTEHILHGAGQERELYVLLTAILQDGDPKLIRAAEVNLRSLLKQARSATVPWQSRPPGHFEPPSD